MITEAEALRAILQADDEAGFRVLSEPGWQEGGFTVVEVNECDEKRWTRVMEVIVRHETTVTFWRFFYERGLTENQEDFLSDDSVEQVRATERTVVVRTWEPVG